MKILLDVHKCSKCAFEFKAPGLPDMSYGDLLLHSATGYHAYLDAIGDPHFNEISSIVHKIDLVSKKDKWGLADILHGIYGEIVDSAPDGSRYILGGRGPICMKCGNDSMATRTPTNPHEFMDVPNVTYKKWDALNEFEKHELIQKLVKSYLAEHK